MTTNLPVPADDPGSVGVARRLSAAQARRLCEKIAAQAKNLRAMLLELRDGEGWVALGYATWAACCEKEFGYSKRHANRLIQAEQISQQVGPVGPAISERQARELARVPEDQREEVLQWAQEKAGEKPLTGTIIREAADEVLEAEPEEEDQPPPEQDEREGAAGEQGQPVSDSGATCNGCKSKPQRQRGSFADWQTFRELLRTVQDAMKQMSELKVDSRHKIPARALCEEMSDRFHKLGLKLVK